MNDLIICVSRIYAIDGVETNITAEGDTAQAALRNLERAAEELGAAPGALPLTKQEAPKNKGGRPRKVVEDTPSAATADTVPEAPALPSGVATAFAPAPSVAVDLAGGGASYTAAPAPVVTLSDAPPVPLGHSSVHLAPPAGPPTFAPPPPAPVFAPPPPADPLAEMRGEALRTLGGIATLVTQRSPGWLDSVTQTTNQVLASFGGNVHAMTKDQVEGYLTQLRAYDATLKQHLGA